MRPKKGFLLLEAVLSVLFVTGWLLVVTLSFSYSKKLLLASRELFQTTLLLQEKMAELTEKQELLLGTDGGVWKEPEAGWSSNATLLENSGLAHVELEVFAPGKPGTGRTLETYLRQKKT